jgi:hypothetical protein
VLKFSGLELTLVRLREKIFRRNQAISFFALVWNNPRHVGIPWFAIVLYYPSIQMQYFFSHPGGGESLYKKRILKPKQGFCQMDSDL